MSIRSNRQNRPARLTASRRNTLPQVGSQEDLDFAMPMSRDPRQGNCELGKLGGSQSTAGRVMFRFLPTDQLELNLTGDVTRSDGDPNVDTQLTPRGGPFDTCPPQKSPNTFRITIRRQQE